MTASATTGSALTERRTGEQHLIAKLDMALQGRASFSTLAGRCGNGQYALLRRVTRIAEERGMPVLHAGAGRPENLLDYAGVRRIISGLSGLDADRVIEATTTGSGSPLPGLYEVLNTVRALPALLVIRDSRWLDLASRRWLRAFVHRLPGYPVAVVLGGTHVAEEADWLGVRPLRELIPVAELELPPLTDRGVQRAIEVTLGRCPEAAFAAAAARLSAGAPAVLDHMLRLFAAGRREPVAAAVPELDATAASAWAEHAGYVLRDLPDDATAVLRAIAVCDGRLELPLVYTLAEPFTRSAPRMRALLDGCGLTLADGDRLRVVSPHVTTRLLDDMLTGDRADLHARAAELAHRAGVADEQVADMLLRARPVGERWAVHRLRRSSSSLYRSGRYESARAHLSRALSEPLTPRLRMRLGVELAGVEALTTPEASDRRLAEIARFKAHGSPQTAVAAIDLCLARGDADRSRQSVLYQLTRSDQDARDQFVALGALADQLRSNPAELAVPAMPDLLERSVHPSQAGVRAWRLALRGENLTGAVALARAALTCGEVMPRLAACHTLILAEELNEAEAVLDRMIWQLRGGYAAAALGRVLATRAELQLRRGRIDLADRDMHDATRSLPMCNWHPLILPQLLNLRILVDIEAGRTRQALEAAERAVPAGVEDGPYWPFLLFARALTASVDGRPTEAAALLRHCGRAMSRQGWLNPALLPWRPLAMQVASWTGETGQARRLVVEELESARRWGTNGVTGWAELHRQMLGATSSGDSTSTAGADEDRSGIERAVTLLRRSPGRLAFGWSMTELAHHQLAGGDREGAALSLNAAEPIAAVCPEGRLARRLRPLREALRRGASSRTAAPFGPLPDTLLLHPAWAGLTESERLTATLAGRGNRNRHIAVLLSVSERTVELRLSRVYKAMQLRGRGELRALVQAAGGG